MYKRATDYANKKESHHTRANAPILTENDTTNFCPKKLSVDKIRYDKNELHIFQYRANDLLTPVSQIRFTNYFLSNHILKRSSYIKVLKNNTQAAAILTSVLRLPQYQSHDISLYTVS